MLLLADVIIFSLIFLMYSSCPCLGTSTQSAILVNPLLPSFLETNSLSRIIIEYKYLKPYNY